MGLYDQVNQTNTPFMSQFVGSVVPELNAYAGTMQKRYDTAADSDDALSEALANLQHLGLDSDVQYANELKSQVYQELQSRAESGDFENMGRRTRQSAIRFSQAYQPLMQRQKDYAEVVKKIQSDDKISDPVTKAALIRKFQHENTMKRDPLTGDFEREGNGRIKLGAIQDAVYAPDVDINKKLLDALSKKEADINAGRYFSDGRGNLINTIEKVRDPRYIAELASEMQKNDPEIKAMINRDVDLQTYNMDPDTVRQRLTSAGIAKSPYQQLKAKGANSREINSYLKSQGMTIDQAKISYLDRQKAQLLQSGYSEDGAEKAILNDQLAKDIRNSHSGLVGGILGYRQESNDHMTDHMFVIRATAAAMKPITDPNLMVIDGTTATTSQLDPQQLTKDYTVVKQDVQATADNAQAAILAGLTKTGMSTGNAKKDISVAIELMHNPVKLNALKLELAKTNPLEAQILEGVALAYQNKAAIAGVQESNVKDMERAGNVNIDALYKQYLKDKQSRSLYNAFDNKPVSKEQFTDQVRSLSGSTASLFTHPLTDPKIMKAATEYQKGITEGHKAMVDGTSQAAGYHPIVPTGPGKAAQITDAVNEVALSAGLTGINLNDPTAGPVDIVKAMGIDASQLLDRKTKAMEKGLNIHLNTETVNDKPTATVTSADGKSMVFQIQNLPVALQDEYNDQVHRAGAAANTSQYGQRLMKQGLAGFGSTEMTDITPQYLKTINPGASGVVKKLNDNFSTRVIDAGAGNRRYLLLTNEADGSHRATGHKFDSVDDLTVALGKYRVGNVTTKSEQATMNNQR